MIKTLVKTVSLTAEWQEITDSATPFFVGITFKNSTDGDILYCYAGQEDSPITLEPGEFFICFPNDVSEPFGDIIKIKNSTGAGTITAEIQYQI